MFKKSSVLPLVFIILLFFVPPVSAAEIEVVSVEASSQFPSDSSSYYPKHTIDKNNATAWFPKRINESNKGEWIRFDFESTVTLTEMKIINGWIKNTRLWRDNSRIKDFELEFSNGEKEKFRLDDEKETQSIALSGVNTRWVKLIIQSSYSGSYIEAGITDVSFWGEKGIQGNDLVSLKILTPKDAIIKIINIGPKYEDGIRLQKGKYHISVSKPGFKDYKEWVDISKDEVLEVELSPQGSNEKSNGSTFDSHKPSLTNAKISDIQLRDFNVEGSFLWGDVTSQYLLIEQLLWQDEPINAAVGKHWKEAEEYCSDLTLAVDGKEVNGFHLPSKENLNELYSYKALLKYSAPGKYYSSSTWSFMLRGGGYVINFSDGKESSIEESNLTDYHYRCVASFSGASGNIDVREEAVAIAAQQLKSQQILDLPEKPQLFPDTEVSILVKDEFETIAQHKARVLAEERRVAELNSSAEREYQIQAKKWELKVEQLKKNHQQKLAGFDENKIKLHALREAISRKYGNPVINSAEYDADNGVFSVRITTTRGVKANPEQGIALNYLFDETIIVPVDIKFARDVKKTLLTPEFQPRVEVSVHDNKIAITGIRNLENVNSLVSEKTEFEEAYNSVLKLTEFLKRHQETSYTAKASYRLAQLKEQQIKQLEIERKQKEKELQEKQERLAQQQEDYELLRLGRCEIGGSVLHREKWNTKTSSGNVIADALFNASTKEEFILVFEGVVEEFVGNKVKVIINDYRIKQTLGGGYLQPRTARKYEFSEYADKYLGKIQFYDRERCDE